MPLSPGLGYKSSILFAKETTPGTAATAAEQRFELLGFSWNGNLSVIEDPSMTATQLSRRFIGPGGQYVTGTFRVRLNYEGHEYLWRMILGLATSAAVETGVKDWTLKEATTATLLSHTLDVSMGDVPSGKVTRFVGVFATGFRFNIQAGGGDTAMGIVEVDFVAASATANATPMTTASFPTPFGVINSQLLRTTGIFKDGSGAVETDISLQRFSLDVSIPHDSQRFYMGSVNADSPVRNGPLDATMTFEEEWNAVSLMNAVRNNTMTALKLVFQHPTTIGTTSKREFEIHATAPTGSEYTQDISGFGAIRQRAGYRLAYDASTDSSALVVRFRNTNSATSPL